MFTTMSNEPHHKRYNYLRLLRDVVLITCTQRDPELILISTSPPQSPPSPQPSQRSAGSPSGAGTQPQALKGRGHRRRVVITILLLHVDYSKMDGLVVFRGPARKCDHVLRSRLSFVPVKCATLNHHPADSHHAHIAPSRCHWLRLAEYRAAWWRLPPSSRGAYTTMSVDLD